MDDAKACAGCGRPSHAEVEGPCAHAWYGSRHDTSRFVVLGTAKAGPACDACLDDMLSYGLLAKYADMDGLEPPSRLGRPGAIALFLMGARRASTTLGAEWLPSTTRAVVLRTDNVVSVDATMGSVPLPSWMAASGQLWRGLSGSGSGPGQNESDFEALGALYLLVAKASGRDADDASTRHAGSETYDRELAVEAQIEAARAREAF